MIASSVSALWAAGLTSLSLQVATIEVSKAEWSTAIS